MASERLGCLRCDACGWGAIGPDITGRPTCYGCGPMEMAPNCPDCGHSIGVHTDYGCAAGCGCMHTPDALGADIMRARSDGGDRG